ncbi:hypothetical protein [Pseudomonas petrae]|uniref:hypothetical protein n=1 Tax=Pseudomonas petrae TaxID=2912190 RepID=UPI001EF07285|nr:hypothetical protein [Pseudomonas petrae]MCF7530735.1 hypothetical protein [Pseudomonas petrae]MCF7536407.1 hypothetical protein [Pseudomonas petrae]MCF7554086.1 hypothetical protein [Pseudomonas petrae]
MTCQTQFAGFLMSNKNKNWLSYFKYHDTALLKRFPFFEVTQTHEASFRYKLVQINEGPYAPVSLSNPETSQLISHTNDNYLYIELGERLR